MGKLTAELRQKLINALLALNVMQHEDGRDSVARNLPSQLRSTIERSKTPLIDLHSILKAADEWNDVQLAQLLNDVVELVAGSEIALELVALRQHLGGESKISSGLRPPYHAPLPPLDPWMDRPEFTQTRDTLLAGGLSTLTTAEGRGGIGKTSLAAKLAWDDIVRAHFTGWGAMGDYEGRSRCVGPTSSYCSLFRCRYKCLQ